jgi:hypothetical protein
MGKMAEMQRKLLEVRSPFGPISRSPGKYPPLETTSCTTHSVPIGNDILPSPKPALIL